MYMYCCLTMICFAIKTGTRQKPHLSALWNWVWSQRPFWNVWRIVFCILQSPLFLLPPPLPGEHDMDRVFTLPQTTFIGGEQTALPLREIIRRLEVIHFMPVLSQEFGESVNPLKLTSRRLWGLQGRPRPATHVQYFWHLCHLFMTDIVVFWSAYTCIFQGKKWKLKKNWDVVNFL